MNKNTYTGSKLQNHLFGKKKGWTTLFVVQPILLFLCDCVGYAFLDRKIKRADTEELLENIEQMEARVVIEELLEERNREQLLLQEAEGKYPEWNKMSDEHLVAAIYLLSDEERKLIYQHVFEERTFKEMSRLNGLSEDRCKGIYYYAIKKIRKMMGGRR